MVGIVSILSSLKAHCPGICNVMLDGCHINCQLIWQAVLLIHQSKAKCNIPLLILSNQECIMNLQIPTKLALSIMAKDIQRYLLKDYGFSRWFSLWLWPVTTAWTSVDLCTVWPSWTMTHLEVGFLNLVGQILVTFWLPCCGTDITAHFMCDIFALIQLPTQTPWWSLSCCNGGVIPAISFVMF